MNGIKILLISLLFVSYSQTGSAAPTNSDTTHYSAKSQRTYTRTSLKQINNYTNLLQEIFYETKEEEERRVNQKYTKLLSQNKDDYSLSNYLKLPNSIKPVNNEIGILVLHIQTSSTVIII